MPCSSAMAIQVRGRCAVRRLGAQESDIWLFPTTERCLSYDELPLLLFQKLKESGQKPVFMLRHIVSHKEEPGYRYLSDAELGTRRKISGRPLRSRLASRRLANKALRAKARRTQLPIARRHSRNRPLPILASTDLLSFNQSLQRLKQRGPAVTGRRRREVLVMALSLTCRVPA